MQRIALAVLFTTCLAPSCVRGSASRDVVGSGKAASATRTVAAFERIEASGAFCLEVRAGAAEPAVTVEGDDNVVPLFETTVKGDTLTLRLPGGRSYDYRTPLVVRVDAPALERLGASGAIGATATGISGGHFESNLSGACTLDARGTADSVKFQGSGAIEVDAFDLVAKRVEVEMSGSSRAHVHAMRHLEVDTSGASDVLYQGSPVVVADSSGASSVRPAGQDAEPPTPR